MLDKVIEHYRTQSALADAIGASPQMITNWKRRGIPAAQALKIERVTKGKFKARDLCGKAA